MTSVLLKDTQQLPDAFLRTYGSAHDGALERKALERRGYLVWSGMATATVNRAVYVVRERLRERSLRWYFGPVFDAVRLRWTEAQARAYQLLHIFFHEFGHHHDRMTTKRQVRGSRGESYAEAYARQYEDLIWDRYLRVFDLD